MTWRLLVEYVDGTFRVYEDSLHNLTQIRCGVGERLTWTRSGHGQAVQAYLDSARPALEESSCIPPEQVPGCDTEKISVTFPMTQLADSTEEA